MDGRTVLGAKRFSNYIALAIVAALPSLCLAQAMGKATVDATATTHVPPQALAANTPPKSTSTIDPAKIEPKIEPKLEAKIEPKIEPKADPKVEPKVENKVDPKLDAKTDVAHPELPVSTTDTTKKPLTSIEQQPIKARTMPPESSAATQSANTPTPAPASGMYNGFISVLQVAGALVAVLGLIFVLRALARKFVPGAAVSNGKGAIEVLARHPLSKTQSLVLVRIGSQIVALNQGKDMSQSVLVISEPTEVARLMGQIEGTNPNSISAGFDNMLATARRDLEEPTDDIADAPAAGANRAMAVEEDFEQQMDEMAAAKRQLMDLRNQVRAVRERLPLK